MIAIFFDQSSGEALDGIQYNLCLIPLYALREYSSALELQSCLYVRLRSPNIEETIQNATLSLSHIGM